LRYGFYYMSLRISLIRQLETQRLAMESWLADNATRIKANGGEGLHLKIKAIQNIELIREQLESLGQYDDSVEDN